MVARDRAELFFGDSDGHNRLVTFIFEAKEPNDTVLSREVLQEMADFEQELFHLNH